jgi:hypothetical protein
VLLPRLDQRRARRGARLGIPHYVLNLRTGSPPRHPELRERVQPRPHADPMRALQFLHEVSRPARTR